MVSTTGGRKMPTRGQMVKGHHTSCSHAPSRRSTHQCGCPTRSWVSSNSPWLPSIQPTPDAEQNVPPVVILCSLAVKRSKRQLHSSQGQQDIVLLGCILAAHLQHRAHRAHSICHFAHRRSGGCLLTTGGRSQCGSVERPCEGILAACLQHTAHRAHKTCHLCSQAVQT